MVPSFFLEDNTNFNKKYIYLTSKACFINLNFPTSVSTSVWNLDQCVCWRKGFLHIFTVAFERLFYVRFG